MKTISISKARGNFKAVLDDICTNNDVVTITSQRHDSIVVMSLENFNEMQRKLKNIS